MSQETGNWACRWAPVAVKGILLRLLTLEDLLTLFCLLKRFSKKEIFQMPQIFFISAHQQRTSIPLALVAIGG